MLNGLNKEMLNEIGIVVIGDVLSILKHVEKLTTDQREIKVTQETHNQDFLASVVHVTPINLPPKSESEVSITNIVLTIYFKDNFYFLKEREKKIKKSKDLMLKHDSEKKWNSEKANRRKANRRKKN